MDKEKAKTKQSLVLALVGDSVETLFVRQWFAEKTDLKVNAITKMTNRIVNAKAQAESLSLIEHLLKDDEKDVVKRARNTHTHSTAKNYAVIDYRYATAFEALIGYLYLSEENKRLMTLLEIVFQHFFNKNK